MSPWCHALLPGPVVAAVAGALLAGCLGDVAEPVRDLRVVLDSPNGPEGAAVIELVGPGLGEVTAPAGIMFSHVAGDTTRVVILLDQAGTIEFTVQVSGRTYPGVAVLQVADEQDNARSLAGYRARIVSAGERPL